MLFVVVVRRPLEPHKVRQPKKEVPAIKEESEEGGGGGGGVFLLEERDLKKRKRNSAQSTCRKVCRH